MRREKLKFGVIADPIASFNPEAETTFFILKEITRRGHETRVMELKDLFIKSPLPPFVKGGGGGDLQVCATARKVHVTQKGKRFVYESDDEKEIILKNLDCLFLRKDPPVDPAYIDHLTLLEIVCGGSTSPNPSLQRRGESPPLCKGRSGGVERPLMINSPAGIKKANEKIYPFYFSGVSPPSVVSQSGDVLLSFLKKIKKGVIKPLDAGGGKGVLLIHHGDPDAKSLLEVATQNFTRYVLLQKYIPEAKKGDKRVLLWNGEPLGSFLRVPSRDDFRGNLHSGARFVKSPLTQAEKKLLARLKPALLRDGLLFAGVDLIGPYVTEINVTSPMGIREINHCDHSQIEKSLLNAIEFAFNTFGACFPFFKPTPAKFTPSPK